MEIRNIEQQNGITLVALIITIIVLLLLVGVGIALWLGENGIFNTAQQAGETHNIEQVREKVILMLSDYAANQYSTQKTLLEYLNEQKANGQLQEVTDNKDGTYTFEIDGYEVIIKESDFSIIKIEKAQLRPEVSNIKITTDGTKEVAEKEVPEGTPLVINFTHSIKGGTTTVDKQLPYTTNGTETEVTFTIIGTVNEKTHTKNITISIANRYRKPRIAEVVNVGDFVNYSAGNWTQNDIAKLGSMYSGTALPTAQGKFGGFGTNTSKDSTINSNNTNMYSGGWRVLSKNSDGTIKIIHAGTCESYYSKKGYANGSKGVFSSRNWSMYEDCSTDAVNTNYVIKGSGHSVTKEEALAITKKSSLQYPGTRYWIPYIHSYNEFGYINSYGNAMGAFDIALGIRPVVTLKAEVQATANQGDSTHTTQATAWNLSLEE